MMAAPDFIEIGTPDMASTSAFFEGVMGWNWVVPKDSEGGGYFTDGTRKVGMHAEGSPCMVPYLSVQDIEVAVGKVKEKGGAVMGEIPDAPGFGRFATCTDPQGVRFGLHQE